MPQQFLIPDPKIQNLAASYARLAGLPYQPGPMDYLPVDEARAARIADYYHRLPHDPQNPAVRESYRRLQAETLAQYIHALRAGIKFEPWLRASQPYRDSREMAADARQGHLYFFTGGEFPSDHLLAQPSGLRSQGLSLTYNDLFRAVHDYFGHALYGNQFGPRGEEHAWRTHSRMFSPAARPAMTSETRGQNSWVNFGPHIRAAQARGQTIPPPQRPYAEQKNLLLPAEFHQ